MERVARKNCLQTASDSITSSCVTNGIVLNVWTIQSSLLTFSERLGFTFFVAVNQFRTERMGIFGEYFLVNLGKNGAKC